MASGPKILIKLNCKLTYEDMHLLQASINGQVHSLKRKKNDLSKRFEAEKVDQATLERGSKALDEKIKELHALKAKLGVTKGFSQYSKPLLSKRV